MRPEKIREALVARPFRRLRVFMSDGSSHDVPHPEFAMITAHQLIIASDVNLHGVPRHSVAIDPVHVTRIEPQPEPPVSIGPNGKS